ncbi:MAG: sulfatase-like hydrolase/transferase [Emcibacteraceae bacterium]|nr:sulfatase-like hydrolase/transferase [Emcibacteraceae bacterium]
MNVKLKKAVFFKNFGLIGLFLILTFQIASAKQPNIVIIYADDLGYGDLGVYGNPSIKTPKIDQLAKEGQKWTNFYVAAPVCTPSRAALLTGKYPVRNGLYGKEIGVFFPNAKGGIPEEEITIAEILKSNGYITAMFGKWHLGDAEYALPTRHGFDQWLGLPYSNDMDPTFELTDNDREKFREKGITNSVRRRMI